MEGFSSQAMIVHFPPCWSLIYFRLPHEMATSSMVYIHCTFAWPLMLHASSHATSLINMKPGEPGFAWRGKAEGFCQTGNPQVKEYITWKLALLGTLDEQEIIHWGNNFRVYKALGMVNTTPTTPNTPPANTPKAHSPNHNQKMSSRCSS